MGRAELGNGTTGDRHGEGLAGLGPTEHLADVVTQLLLCDVAHADQGSRPATLLSPESVRSKSLAITRVGWVTATMPWLCSTLTR